MTYAENTIADILSRLRLDADGLLPAIAQDAKTGQVLMLAWMNADAVRETLTTGRVCYWSRSRGKLWRKGERSKQEQKLVEFFIDCDGDSVLLKVEQTGVACHTGRISCFYQKAEAKGVAEAFPVLVSPETLYGERD